MSKKNRRNKPEAVETPAPETPAPETSLEVAPETTETPATETPAEAPAAEATPVTETATAKPVFWVNDERPFTPRRGFETVLYAALQGGQFTEDEVVQRILASGEYQRVAPKAAEKRPLKPTRFLLKVWTSSKILKTTIAA